MGNAAILIIDDALPSSVFSGKSVRLLNIYSQLGEMFDLYLLRTRLEGSHEAVEMKAWANSTFKKQFKLVSFPKPALSNRLRALLTLKPWFDLQTKYPNFSKEIRNYLLNIIADKNIECVITWSLESGPFGELVHKNVIWLQDLGDSMGLQLKRRIEKSSNLKEKVALAIRRIREGYYERKAIHTAIKTFFVAEDDAELFDPSKVVVVPNGVDSEYFSPVRVKNIYQGESYVVFSGHMNFPPNIDCATYLVHEIYPKLRSIMPNLGCKIVGADPSEAVLELRKIKGVEVTGRVEDLRPYLKGAKVFVCPMRMGSGIKNKLLEAMAMNLPIVASSIAVKGLPMMPEKDLIVADGVDSFVHHAIEMINNTAEIDTRQFVSQNYSWQKVRNTYSENLKKYLRKEASMS